MKIKVKYSNEKQLIEAENLEELHSKIKLFFNLNETPILSLNKTDPIPVIGTFEEHHIVNGKLNCYIIRLLLI